MTTLRQPRVATGWMVFLLIAVAGLFYVKWFPYYNRAFVAASQHSIGKSILMGTAASAPEPSWQAALDYAMAYGKAIWQAMVLGLLLGSAVQALIPPRWVARALGEHNFGSVVNGGLMSLPGMMCTCCAAPVVAGLRAREAAPGAAVAFWLGNTVLNPAALVFMGFVLGWQWTGLRLALGVLMVFGLGYAVNRMVTPAQAASSRAALAKLVEEDEPGTAFSRWIKILGRMTVRLVPEYIVLVLLLGAARAWLFPHIGPDIGNGMLWIVAFAVAGTLFVIPTAGEVPIIQAMLSLGMATGPAGALLMTLPPVSVPSLAMLARSFPPRVLAFVAAAVVLFGIVSGLIAAALF
ncbi:membrane protein [Caballeronia novacaledonica]|uniref:Membrane protein n=1 Tax=Caballeronia novacaledonica TaxID=1544861 RepID=A0A2U3HZZ2_9BURK|nr:permease [Caballeronia novacaledonica]SPB13383.1 membrane protein [Caballeronia novacaledonica]